MKIELHLSPVEGSYDFFNSCPSDPARGLQVRFDEIEDQWSNILNYLEGEKSAKIYLRGFDDPVICLIYLLRGKKIERSHRDFAVVNGDVWAEFVEDDGEIDLTSHKGQILSNLRGKWLFS